MRSYRPNHEKVYRNLLKKYREKLGEVSVEDSYVLLYEIVNNLASKFKSGNVEIKIFGDPEERIWVEIASPTFPFGRGYRQARRYGFSRRKGRNPWSRNAHYIQTVAFLSALEVLLRGKELHTGKFRYVFDEVFPNLRGSFVTRGVRSLLERKLEFVEYDRVSDIARLKEGVRVKVMSTLPEPQRVKLPRHLKLEAIIST